MEYHMLCMAQYDPEIAFDDALYHPMSDTDMDQIVFGRTYVIDEIKGCTKHPVEEDVSILSTHIAGDMRRIQW